MSQRRASSIELLHDFLPQPGFPFLVMFSQQHDNHHLVIIKGSWFGLKCSCSVPWGCFGLRTVTKNHYEEKNPVPAALVGAEAKTWAWEDFSEAMKKVSCQLYVLVNHSDRESRVRPRL